ncbi:MAG: hypothetical protein AAF184_19025 [Pseudomonadota bacterium]
MNDTNPPDNAEEIPPALRDALRRDSAPTVLVPRAVDDALAQAARAHFAARDKANAGRRRRYGIAALAASVVLMGVVLAPAVRRPAPPAPPAPMASPSILDVLIAAKALEDAADVSEGGDLEAMLETLVRLEPGASEATGS